MLSSVTMNSRNLLKLWRIDHWIKNVLIVPGYVLALLLLDSRITLANLINLIASVFAACFASSSNYIINEYIDRDADKYHPLKSFRVSAKISFEPRIITFMYLASVSISIAISWFVSNLLVLIISLFIVCGLVYNVPPIRLKDRPLIDVYLESVNSPIRFVIGWTAVDTTSLPPISTVLLFLFGGAFLMTAKRVSELSVLQKAMSQELITLYRKSFAFYTIARLFFIMQFNFGISITLVTLFTLKYNPDFLLYIVVVITFFSLYTKNVVENEIHVTEKPHYMYKDTAFLLILFFGALFYYLVSVFDIGFFENLIETSELNLEILRQIARL